MFFSRISPAVIPKINSSKKNCWQYFIRITPYSDSTLFQALKLKDVEKI
jgi:hypothetical protein